MIQVPGDAGHLQLVESGFSWSGRLNERISTVKSRSSSLSYQHPEVS